MLPPHELSIHQIPSNLQIFCHSFPKALLFQFWLPLDPHKKGEEGRCEENVCVLKNSESCRIRDRGYDERTIEIYIFFCLEREEEGKFYDLFMLSVILLKKSSSHSTKHIERKTFRFFSAHRSSRYCQNIDMKCALLEQCLHILSVYVHTQPFVEVIKKFC